MTSSTSGGQDARGEVPAPKSLLRERSRKGARVFAIAAIFAGSTIAPRIAAAAETPTSNDKALPCRPTIACTADITPPGALEVEAGMLFRRLGGETRQWSFPLLAKLTLEKWIQVQLGTNGYTTAHGASGSDRAQYFDNAAAVAKLHLLDQGTIGPSVSLSISANVPTVKALGYVRTYGAGAVAYVSKDFGPLHADLNLGLNVLRLGESSGSDGGGAVGQEWTALALSAEPIKHIGTMLEGYVFSDARPATTHDGGLLFAISHAPRPWLIFDVGGDIGVYPSARAYSAFVGLTIVPVILWRVRPSTGSPTSPSSR
jgi:hypothetical protein